ncbi:MULTISPECIES: flagellar motor switch protein FliG [Brucella]|jgi:flagellar motor switch protein FliG|uniref:Flagellar motor switch protein FliG n=1 Tax=Brucella pseudogrignonensis TaxID=419475 RepID=A0A256GG81_9HYPH|nr:MULTISPECIES: flagellar motor switch protein FliG [Brucella]EMG53398.1 flagellar motor switch protein G [Ochrobactrum sp. CDB2]MQP41646.1 flagellar motor switch protein FliG [Ochrobactrum sp. MYb237]NNV19035.1 flagellar motor switch protein FliG [Brucella pseudogrignonensis]OYR26133.1 mgtE intracellular N domain protein [Brucella pseudogrignonensis]PQZ40197.1 flagellar motor switch protein FliG [Brucella pseudogrignonensis]
MADNESQKPLDDSVSGVIDTLSGPQKAAAILVAIGRPSASRLLKHFNAEDLRKLAGHARTLEPISPLDFEHLVKQFEDSFAEGAPVSEAAQRFEGLLREALPQDEADAVFEERVQPQLVQESVWVQLARLPVESLQAYLADQHPQIIAYIVSKLPSDLAARMFVGLPPQLRSAVVQRSLHIGNVAPAAADLLEDVLRRDLLGRSDAGPVKAHHGQIANIFNQLDRQEMEELMSSLKDLSQDDIARIKAKLFNFEDVERLSQRARLLLFDEVQTEQIATALRGADASLQEMVLSSLSTRGRRMVESELAAEQGNITSQNIADARRAIARIAIDLSERGIITLDSGEDPS